MTSTDVGHAGRPVASAQERTRVAPTTWMPERPAVVAALVGLVAFVVSFAGSWIPSFWGDEAASIMSAERPWPSLLHELGRVDAVHGTYYALLHLWIDVFGASPLATRLPSAIAVGVAAAGIVVLACRRAGVRVALVAALVFAVLPRTTYMGAEVRSYALSTACAVWLCVLFLRLVTRGSRSLPAWVGFAAGYAACIYVFLYLALLVLPFAALLLWECRGRWRAVLGAVAHPHRSAAQDVRGLRAVIVRWAVATIGGVLLAVPVEAFALKERGQIKFLGRHPGVDLYTFTVAQWFDYNGAVAVLAWAAVIGLAVAGVVLWRRRRAILVRMPGPAAGGSYGEHAPARPSRVATGSGGALRADRARLLVLSAAWFALPPLALLAVNAVVPAYTVRYMSFTTPALALLMAFALDATAGWTLLRWRPRSSAARRMRVVALAGVVLVAALAAPTYAAQRDPYAKNGGSDWAEVAAVIQDHSRPGDDIVFDETTRPSRRPRLAMHLYPEQFRNVVDVALEIPYVARDSLWDKAYTIPEVGSRLEAGDGRVWLVEYRGPDKDGLVTSTGEHVRMSELRALGFVPVHAYRLHRDVVYLFARGSSS